MQREINERGGKERDKMDIQIMHIPTENVNEYPPQSSFVPEQQRVMKNVGQSRGAGMHSSSIIVVTAAAAAALGAGQYAAPAPAPLLRFLPLALF